MPMLGITSLKSQAHHKAYTLLQSRYSLQPLGMALKAMWGRHTATGSTKTKSNEAAQPYLEHIQSTGWIIGGSKSQYQGAKGSAFLVCRNMAGAPRRYIS